MDSAPGTSITLSLRMAKAMSLARGGQLKEAQALIADDRTIPDHPLALHALAALVTSEGDYLRALKLWELLLQKEPAHAEARRMVDAIELWLGRPPWMRYWQLYAATGVAILAAALFWVLLPSTPRGADALEPRVPPSATTGPLVEESGPILSPEAPTRERERERAAPAAVPYTPPPTVKFKAPAEPPRKRSNSR